MVENAELEEKFQAEIESLKDATYIMFEEGFNETVAQVKHFNTSVLIDFSLVDREKKLSEILGQKLRRDLNLLLIPKILNSAIVLLLFLL